MGNSGVPPSNTAIGQVVPNSDELQSWPMTGLRFLQIPGPRSFDKLSNQSYQEGEPSQIEDYLVALHSRKANIAFLLLGSSYYQTLNIGVSHPEPDAMLVTNLLNNIFSSDLKSFENLTDETIKSLMLPVCSQGGLIINRSNSSAENLQHHRQNLMECLATALKGKHFGLLTLAIPIPSVKVKREEFLISDEVSRIQGHLVNQVDDGFLLKETGYLNRVKLGMRVGMWLTGIYYFAKSSEVISLIESTLGREGFEHLTLERPLGLTRHILNLGLLRNKNAEPVIEELLEYRYLTPLNSRDLTEMLHIPL